MPPFYRHRFYSTQEKLSIFAMDFKTRLVQLFLLLMISSVNSCPSVCICRGSQVDCSGKNLNTLPTSLPKQIIELKLHHNRFTEVPDISEFVELEVLDLSYNAISSINITRTSKLSKLQQLDLSHNELKALPNGMFSRTNVVEKIDVSFNNLADITAMSSPFTMLKELNLQNNRITSLDIIRDNKMSMLNVLRAGHNDIQKLEAPLDSNRYRIVFSSLQYLELNNNKISSISMYFTRFSSLKKIVLSYNDLLSLDGSALLNLYNLQELYLDHNKFSSVTYMWFSFKKKLTYLDLSFNQIHNIADGAFQSALNVKYIDLSNNNLESLGTAMFYQLQSLTYLNLHNNNIHYVSDHAFFGLQNLLYLNMSKNDIALGEKEFDTAFEPLLRLKILDLNENNILLIPSNSFSGLSTLKTLYLRHNDIKIIETNAFKQLSGVNSVYFESNDLLCDCSIRSLRKWILENSFTTTVKGICSAPAWLKDKNIMNVLDTELVCDAHHDKRYTNRPKVILQPKSIYAFLNGNATLNCVVTSSKNSPMMIKWYKGSRAVLHSTVRSSEQVLIGPQLYKRNSTLTIDKVSFQDAGRYWCHVSNIFGSDWSTNANLTIVVAPKLSSALKTNIVARSGETIYIPCSAEGLPTPHIHFKKENSGLTFPAVDEKRIIYTEHKFGIQRLKIKDSGDYSCTAVSAVGKANQTIRLIVIEKPKFIRPMKDKVISIGSTAVVDCIVSGNPKPKIVWYKDNVLVQLTSRIKISNQLLVISSFDYHDAAIYACEVSNRLGTTRQTAKLTVGPSKKTYSSKMPSEIFITVIVITVVAVTVLTSLVWIALICFCRKKRHQRAQQEGTNLVSMYTEESLLPDIPRDYVLKCNGKLVNVPTRSETPLDPLLEDAREYLRQQQSLNNGRQINRQSSDDEDDSGVALIYPKYDGNTFSPTASTQAFPAVHTSRYDKKLHRTSDLHDQAKLSPDSASHRQKNNNGDFVTLKKGSPSIRMPRLNRTVEFDPTRLKLKTSSTNFNRLKYDSLATNCPTQDDLYQAYVTSSSGIESGGSSSSENVSLANEEVISV